MNAVHCAKVIHRSIETGIDEFFYFLMRHRVLLLVNLLSDPFKFPCSHQLFH